jgi:uncharacterized protein (DUF302 family)
MSGRPEITTKTSPLSVGDTVSRLLELIEARELKVFAVIDQSAEAQRVGLHLPPTTLVIFGNPGAGTRVTQAVPLVAIDLPLKVLVWADGEETKVSYLAPEALGARHHLDADLTESLAGHRSADRRSGRCVSIVERTRSSGDLSRG